jgi:two-component system sensor histidine kinase KdpD
MEPFFLATLIVAGVSVIAWGWVSAAGARNLGQLYLAGILLVAITLGMRPALLAAGLAFLSYDVIMVEPRLALKTQPGDWLVLINFMVTALVVGALAGRLRDHARAVSDRLADVTLLLEASRDLSAVASQNGAVKVMLHHMERKTLPAAVWLENDEGVLTIAVRSPDFCMTASDEEAATALFRSSAREIERDNGVLFSIHTAERRIGVAAIAYKPKSLSEGDRRWMAALLKLGAIAIDRNRLVSELAESKLVSEREGLRTALLSSLSHDLRTPLSTILASATSLKVHDALFDPAIKYDLLDGIEEEAERLSRYVTNLLEMTKLESGALKLRLALVDPGEIISFAISRVQPRLEQRVLRRSVTTEGTRIQVDPVLMEQALCNVLENAIAHTHDRATICVSAKQEGHEIIIAVTDDGPGIHAKDLGAVFEKFFCGGDSDRGRGVGLGLSVTRGLVEAFDGAVKAISPAQHGRGTQIQLRLKAYPALETIE